MAARSSGMFPRKAAWVDAATIIPADGSALTVPNLQHSGEVTLVAYFSDDAAGSIAVTLGSETVTLAAADQRDKKVIKVRSGYELGPVTSVTADYALLSAGSAQVSIF